VAPQCVDAGEILAGRERIRHMLSARRPPGWPWGGFSLRARVVQQPPCDERGRGIEMAERAAEGAGLRVLAMTDVCSAS